MFFEIFGMNNKNKYDEICPKVSIINEVNNIKLQ